MISFYIPEARTEGRFVIERYKDGSGYFMTRASGRQVIAAADTLKELQKFAKSHGFNATYLE
jgi:hypothetical protein